MKLLSNQDQYIHFEKIEKKVTELRDSNFRKGSNSKHIMTSNIHLLPNYFSIHFSARTLHFVCNIITDNLSLE